MKTVRRAIFWAIGLGLLAWLVQSVGVGSAWSQIKQLGWGYFPVLLISLGWHLCNTWAWAVCFDPAQPRPGLWSLFCAKISGEAVGNVTPASHVGGEVAKAYMLRGHMSVSQGVPSLVVNKTIELVSGLAFSFAGACVAVLQFNLPMEVQMGLGVALLLGTLGIVVAFVSQRQSTFVWFVNLSARLHLKFLESRREKFAEMDRLIAAFYRQNTRGFVSCLALHILSWVLGTLEIYVILILLGQPQSFLSAFLSMSLSLVINTAFFFIPSGVGVFESGHVFLFQLLGLGAELGLGVALI
ncbi:MAG: lysylphosphatidylglycerol synthase transmembrane domain-containing protein, partial [bacterium]|nr:lysylphosphatidylglycerol synthase transmembrane domain-containing protein [bacterium]